MDEKKPQTFEGVGGISDQQLRWSQWWLDHRVRVRRTGIGMLVIADVMLLGVGAWGFVDWLAIGGIREEQAIRQMTSAGYGRFSGIALEELQVGAPIVLPAATGKIDILLPVENRNAAFWAELRYRLIVGGAELPIRTAFVLPGQAKYLAELSAPTDQGTSVEVKIERRLWRRAVPDGGVDRQAFAETRLNVRAENAVFKPVDPLATSPSSSAAFTLANHTAFGYYDVDLLVLLYRGDAIVGANAVRIDQLPAGAREPMELFWYHSLPHVTKVEVVPDINVYDPDVYRSPV